MEKIIYIKETVGEFGEFYEKYFTMVYKYIYRKIDNPQIAEDITQEIFYIAYIKWLEVKAHPSMQGWLLKTAQYKVLELGRKIGRQSEVLSENLEDEAGGESPPEYGMQELEMSALAELEVDEWKLVKDHYFIGYSIQELAAREGITENNLRVRLSRILKRLRKALDG